MRSGSLIDTPDNYVLSPPLRCPVILTQQLFRFLSDKTCGESDAENKPFFEKSQNNTDHIFSADSSNCLKLTIMSQPPNPRRGERLRKYLERSQLLNNARSVFAKLWRTIFS